MSKEIKNITNSKILLKNGELLNVVNGKKSKKDILIQNGKIVEIGKIDENQNYDIIDCNKKIITQSFIDIHTHLKVPGIGDQETLSSGANAALAGGYSKICVMPDTNPITDNPELIKFIINESRNLPVDLHPIGAITKQLKGVDIAEIGLMINSGAIAISDANMPIMNSQVVRYAMEYAKMFNVPFINNPQNLDLVNKGVMNESTISNTLGLSGNPTIAETVMVYRDLEIANFISGKIHIPNITCKESIDIIDSFKNKNTDVTCEVTPHHLFFTDSDLETYDTNLKISPPFRDEKNRESLINAIKNGLIDCIASSHNPVRFDDKDKDFYHADYGVISLESAFAVTNTILRKHNVETKQILNLFSLNPSKIMNLSLCDMKIGSDAELVIIDPNKEWIFTKSDILSKSHNSPFINQKLKGKIDFTINKTFLFG